MTAMDVGDLAILTGPPELSEGGSCYLTPGEVVKVLGTPDQEGDVLVDGLESGNRQFVSAKSLTSFQRIVDDPDVLWGDLLDPNYVHDYVWTGDDE